MSAQNSIGNLSLLVLHCDIFKTIVKLQNIQLAKNLSAIKDLITVIILKADKTSITQCCADRMSQEATEAPNLKPDVI